MVSFSEGNSSLIKLAMDGRGLREHCYLFNSAPVTAPTWVPLNWAGITEQAIMNTKPCIPLDRLAPHIISVVRWPSVLPSHVTSRPASCFGGGRLRGPSAVRPPVAVALRRRCRGWARPAARSASLRRWCPAQEIVVLVGGLGLNDRARNTSGP